MRLHIDTDLGGDPDDACALALLLAWPGVDVVGITTCLDTDGSRAGYVHHLLHLAGRDDIPVAAGAGATLSRQRAEPAPQYWPADALPRPASAGAALDLLATNIDAGATVLAIGPLTNLALLETLRPGTLGRAPVVAMGGWVEPPSPGLPQWGPEMDWNVQFDAPAAEIVGHRAALTLVALPATLTAWLRAADLPRLRAAGPVGRLLAEQSAAYGVDSGLTALGRAHTGLPDDLLNFHYDPVAAAVAVGWDGAVVEELALKPVHHDGVLRFVPGDQRLRVVTAVDGDAFAELWLDQLERLPLTGPKH